MYIFGLLYACAKLSILLCFPHIALAVTIVNLLWIGRDGKRMAPMGMPSIVYVCVPHANMQSVTIAAVGRWRKSNRHATSLTIEALRSFAP